MGNADGKRVSLEIVGIFLSGSESKQPEGMDSVNRIENQIFIDNESYTGLSDNAGYRKIAVYTKKPDQVDVLVQELKDFWAAEWRSPLLIYYIVSWRCR